MIKKATSSSSLAASTLGLVLLAVPAFAGDISPIIERTSVVPTQTTSWTGFYLGLQAGGSFNPEDDGRIDFDTDRDGNYNDTIAAFGDNFDGSFDSSFSYGIVAGYDYQIGHFVVGALIDVNKMDVSEEQSGFSSTPAFYKEERSLEYLSTARLRLGYAINERFLAYVTGGITYSDVDYQLNTNTPATVVTSGGQEEDYGYTVGAGLEARVTDHVSLTVEYLYTDLGDSDFVTNYSGPAAFSAVSGSTNSRGTDEKFDFHTIQAKITYRF